MLSKRDIISGDLHSQWLVSHVLAKLQPYVLKCVTWVLNLQCVIINGPFETIAELLRPH